LGLKSEDEILLDDFGTVVLNILDDVPASKSRLNSPRVTARQISKSTIILHFPELSTILVSVGSPNCDQLANIEGISLMLQNSSL
jgi:hypothetical protein